MATTLRSVTHSARDFTRAAGKKIDAARDQTGDAIHSVASSVRKGSAKIDVLASGAAKRLDATASFVEDAKFSNALTSLRRFGKNHPAFTLLAGAALGLWIASTVGRPRAHGA